MTKVDALADFKAREEVRVRLAELREKINSAQEQLALGEGVEFDAERIREKGRAILAARRAEA